VSLRELLDRLRAEGIRLRLDGEELVVNAPEGALTEGLREELRGRREEIVTFLAQGAESTAAGVVIPRREPGTRLPLSIAQEGLWLALEGGMSRSSFNLPAAFWLTGPLDRTCLRGSLQAMVDRHESLRTAIRVDERGPHQVVQDRVPLPFEVVDLTHLPADRRRAEAERRMTADAGEPFDLERAPLLRFALFALGEEEHALYLLASHLIWDGSSFDIFLQEMTEGYQAALEGRPPRLEPLELQYGDFTLWQRVWVEGEEHDRQLAFWKDRLAGPLPVLQVPTDHPRPPRQSFRGANEEILIEPGIAQAVGRLARRQGCTPFMLLAAALDVLLHRWSGQDEIILGCPQAGVHSPEMEKMVGFFVNTLVMRTSLGDDPTFLDLLDRVRRELFEVMANRDVPFGHVVAAVAPPRDPSRTPLFQALFTYQDARQRQKYLGEVALDQFHIQTGHIQTDFMFWVKEYDHGLEMGIECATDLYEADTVQRLLASFRHLLTAVVAHPELHVSELSVQGDAELRRQLEQGQGPEASSLRGWCAHQVLERRLAAAGGEVAVRAGEESLTHGELHAQAEALALRLQAAGVGPETLVGICLDRGPRLVVAMLAVMKAGGAFLPLDPAYPQARLDLLMEEAGALHLVHEQATAAAVGRDCTRLDLDAPGPLPEAALVRHDDPNQLAYVLFTSGSTGRPKGVMVEHRQLVNLLEGVRDRFRATRRGVCLAATGVSFDISLVEILGSLAFGLELVLAADPRSAARRPGQADVPALMKEHRVTHFQCTPSQAVMLLGERAGREALAGLEQLLLGGEVFTPELATELLDLGIPRVINGYGPTECTIYTTMEDVEEVHGAVPIGRPLANVSLYILDARMKPVPQGVPGELVVGGDSVARGYLGQPELTAHRFLADPYRVGLGARMYRTGDRVRRVNDGSLEFLGRDDHQVKVRGVRIELGEIENALEGHPAVREAVATVHELSGGDQRLAAYVVLREEGVEPDELRRWLDEALPAYMVPPALVVLDRFPLTANNKIDRKALPLPDSFAVGRDGAELALPRNDQELRLANLWQELLGVEEVGIDEDFFALGGHSLLALDLVKGIEAEFGREVALATIFAHPTVRGLAASLSLGVDEGASKAILLNHDGGGAPLFCPSGVHLYYELARAMPDGHPVYGIFIPPPGGTPDVPTLARAYIEVMREVQPQGPYHLAGFCFGGVLSYEIAQQLRAMGEEVGSLTLMESFLDRGWSRKMIRTGFEAVKLLFRQGPTAFLRKLRAKLGAGDAAPPPPEELADEGEGSIQEDSRRLQSSFYVNATRNYEDVIQPYPGGILYFRAADEKISPVYRVQPGGGFAELAEGGLQYHSTAGDHLGILTKVHVTPLAKRIARQMREGARR
jgi:amino acid adenylation domain-containing protein